MLAPIYGQQTIESERPFKALPEGTTWHVKGYLPLGSNGGVAEIWIDKVDGRIVRYTHGR